VSFFDAAAEMQNDMIIERTPTINIIPKTGLRTSIRPNEHGKTGFATESTIAPTITRSRLEEISFRHLITKAQNKS
jgi:hypothetical protein